MRILKPRWKGPPRRCILISLAIAALFTVLYELAIYCALETMIERSNTSAETVQHTAKPAPNTRSDASNIHADKVLHELSGFRSANPSEMENASVVNTAHFVWCGNETFEFNNYLSVLSVWKVLQPDMIEFHQEHPPLSDEYNDWLEEIKQTIPGFVAIQLESSWDGNENGCGFWYGIAVVEDRGGIYVGNDVIVTEDIVQYRRRDLSIFHSKYPSTSTIHLSIIMGSTHNKYLRQFGRNFAKDKKPTDLYCDVIGTSLVYNDTVPCHRIPNTIHPVDIFTLNTNFGAMTRKLVYGSDKVKEAKGFLPGQIPKIVHYVWFGAKEVNFIMYLSLLSTLFILNPEKVFIYTDGYLYGHFYDRVKKDKRVVEVIRERPLYIYGHKVQYIQHRSDIVRAECLLKYGGIYMDWDVLWLRSPDDVISKGYDVIANFDHMAKLKFPDTVNLGVFMAKPKSVFVKRWQDALVNYKTEDFSYNAILLPYKIYEKYPEYIHIERRLQVMCLYLKCHPTFHKDFKRFNEEQPFNWRTDVYSIHFTHPDPPELDDEMSCRNGEGRFAEIGRYILQHHSKLD